MVRKIRGSFFFTWLILKLILLLFLLPVVAETADVSVASEVAFRDISGHWAEEIILRWQDSGIVCGYPDGTFRPDDPVTRAELAKIITLAFRLEPEEGTVAFSDLDSAEWYYNYVLAAQSYIPTYGPPDVDQSTWMYSRQSDSFFPDQPALRFHVCETFSLLKMQVEDISPEIPTIQEIQKAVTGRFRDGAYTNLYPMHGMIAENVRRFQTYTWLASELGILIGDPDGYFRPYDPVTRAEVLTILDRILDIHNSEQKG